MYIVCLTNRSHGMSRLVFVKDKNRLSSVIILAELYVSHNTGTILLCVDSHIHIGNVLESVDRFTYI